MMFTFARWLVLPLVAALTSAASAQTVLFSDGFENGLGHWVPSGLWNAEAATDACGAARAPFPEGTHGAYYGIDGVCNYDTVGVANAGTLTLATPVAIPATTPTAWLHFWQHLAVEDDSCVHQYDLSFVDASTDGGATWENLSTNCFGNLQQPPSAWYPRSVNLFSYRGQSILVRFRFESRDEQLNHPFGWMIDAVEFTAEPGLRNCGAFCPCANTSPGSPTFGPLSRGCRHSFGGYGELAGDGTASVSNDSLALHASALPPNAGAILLESLAGWVPEPFGDGTLCLIGSLRRVAAHTASAGASTWPGPGDPPLSAALQAVVPPAGLRVDYQVYFRDVASFCTPATFNATNSYSVVWTP
ncbi:MAG: hypothetical protein IPJ77_07045 [Planctomycetes bacterium]|nr:hypothetical protein [Planctomycetota bacterium]